MARCGAPAPGRRRPECRRTSSSRGDRFRNSADAAGCRISFGSPPARIRACPCAEPTQLVGAGGGLNKNQMDAADEVRAADPCVRRTRLANAITKNVYAVDVGPHRRGNMSRNEVNANGSTVTLHMVSSLDG